MEEVCYYKFIDKIKDRKQIPRKEYYKIIDDVINENQEFHSLDVSFIIWNHGWRPKLISDESKSYFYMVKQT